jgi:hypothetical protein
MTEPGSSTDLDAFARWCRALVDRVLAAGDLPALLVADGPALEELVVVEWFLDGTRPPAEDLLAHVVPRWAEATEGSQLGFSLPFGGAPPGVTLLAIDEAGYLLEQAFLDVERLRLGEWAPLALDLPIAAWQEQLAENAGWREFAKWRCRRCRSVCVGEAEDVPSPCDFCGSQNIERVPLVTPLRPPDPRYDQTPPRVTALFRRLERAAR